MTLPWGMVSNCPTSQSQRMHCICMHGVWHGLGVLWGALGCLRAPPHTPPSIPRGDLLKHFVFFIYFFFFLYIIYRGVQDQVSRVWICWGCPMVCGGVWWCYHHPPRHGTPCIALQCMHFAILLCGISPRRLRRRTLLAAAPRGLTMRKLKDGVDLLFSHNSTWLRRTNQCALLGIQPPSWPY